jgi:hypothetical protein
MTPTRRSPASSEDRRARRERKEPHGGTIYEYLHGDNGAGLGASHQPGWTGLASPLVSFVGTWTAGQFLEKTFAGLD